MLRKFRLIKPAKTQNTDTTTITPNPTQFEMPTSLRIKLALYIAFMCIVTFLLGIFLTILMITRPQSGPLALIQRPILAAIHVPPEAQKEWLDLNLSIEDMDRYFYDREKIDHTKIYYAAAQAAMQTVNDTYTFFEQPKVAQALDDNLNGRVAGGGLGVETRVEQDQTVFVDVYPNNPADKAGLKVGDVLLKIDGNDLPHTSDTGKDLEQIGNMLRGDINTKVTITIQRPSENNRVLDITIMRGNIQRPLIETKLLPNSVGYIKIKESFADKTGEEFIKQVQNLVDQGATKFILDVRDNGGGLVETARAILGHFLANGTAFYEKEWNGDKLIQNQTDVTPASTLKLYDQPLVVLVNKNSASASEITAGALQGRKRAVLIGDQTFGKGVAQYVLPLEDGAAARVTYAHWLTPTQIDINHNGLVPDVPIAMDPADGKTGRDTQLERAIQYLQTGQ
jgi:carboxyl-terminal processing protease